MDEAYGRIVLTWIPDLETRDRVAVYLLQRSRTATPERLDKLLQQLPAVLVRNITAERARGLITELRDLGAPVEFRPEGGSGQKASADLLREAAEQHTAQETTTPVAPKSRPRAAGPLARTARGFLWVGLLTAGALALLSIHEPLRQRVSGVLSTSIQRLTLLAPLRGPGTTRSNAEESVILGDNLPHEVRVFAHGLEQALSLYFSLFRHRVGGSPMVMVRAERTGSAGARLEAQVTIDGTGRSYRIDVDLGAPHEALHALIATVRDFSAHWREVVDRPGPASYPVKISTVKFRRNIRSLRLEAVVAESTAIARGVFAGETPPARLLAAAEAYAWLAVLKPTLPDRAVNDRIAAHALGLYLIGDFFAPPNYPSSYRRALVLLAVGLAAQARELVATAPVEDEAYARALRAHLRGDLGALEGLVSETGAPLRVVGLLLADAASRAGRPTEARRWLEYLLATYPDLLLAREGLLALGEPRLPTGMATRYGLDVIESHLGLIAAHFTTSGPDPTLSRLAQRPAGPGERFAKWRAVEERLLERLVAERSGGIVVHADTHVPILQADLARAALWVGESDSPAGN
jgi:hypothetical protein